MLKSIIFIVCAVFFIVINTMILVLKPKEIYKINDDTNYSIYYEKWLCTTIFVGTFMLGVAGIKFALELNHVISFILLILQFVTVMIYALSKYKCIIINGDDIKVQRLFTRDLFIKFKDITKVYYEPNAKIIVNLRKRQSFDVSFNSVNFHKFYMNLIKNKVKFKTSRIPATDNHIYISKYNITINFPKTMFREYYQSERFLRNSIYLFSARSLENCEYIEAYLKTSTKNLSEFLKLVKNDLNTNNFKAIDEDIENIDGMDFIVIKSLHESDKKLGRLAYIYKFNKDYFVIYASYLLENEVKFANKMQKAIRKSRLGDNKYKLANI